MGGLTIEGADIGYDSQGVSQLFTMIRAGVIDEAATAMHSNITELETSLKDIWAGHSADQFIKNMKTDIETISKALSAAESQLHSEINQILAVMGQVDDTLITSR